MKGEEGRSCKRKEGEGGVGDTMEGREKEGRRLIKRED